MKAVDRETIDKEDVRHMSEVQLARLGVRRLRSDDVILQCVTCGETWLPQLDSSGKLPFDYWYCPRKCNL